MAPKKADRKLIPVNARLESLLICALRYAMPRYTFMPEEVAEFIELVWDELSYKAQSVIQGDIMQFFCGNFPVKSPWDRVMALKMDDKKD